jgi:hypothetical protein
MQHIPLLQHWPQQQTALALFQILYHPTRTRKTKALFFLPVKLHCWPRRCCWHLLLPHNPLWYPRSNASNASNALRTPVMGTHLCRMEMTHHLVHLFLPLFRVIVPVQLGHLYLLTVLFLLVVVLVRIGAAKVLPVCILFRVAQLVR